MGALERVKPGEPFEPSAGAHNAFIEAAEFVQSLQGRTLERFLKNVWGTTIVHVKNKSGVDRDRFDVLGIASDVFPTPTGNLAAFKNGPVLYGVKPTVPAYLGRCCILLEPAKPDAIVKAAAGGICIAKVNVVNTDDQFADAKDNDAGSLQSWPAASIRILWKPSGTGVKWCIIDLRGGITPRIAGKLDGALAAGGSATLSVWRLNTGQTDLVNQSADTGENLTVYAPSVLRSGSLAAGKWLEAELGQQSKFWGRIGEC